MTNISPSSSTSTVLNKIVIPVITTVLGATAIYFLGFNKKGGRSDMEALLITKEATVKAWKSFVTAQNISYKNTLSLSEEYGKKLGEEAANGFEALVPTIRDFQEEILRESKKVNQDIEDILKSEDIDRDFVSMMNRALDNNRDQEKKVVTFFDNLVALAKSKRDLLEKQEKWQKETTRFIAMGDKVEERGVTEAEGIAKILAEKYNQSFDLNELLVYAEYKKKKGKLNTEPKPVDDNDPAPVDPNGGGNAGNGGTEYVETNNSTSTDYTEEMFTGTWTMTGGSLELSANGEMYWAFDGKGYTSGKWRLVSGKLQMNAVNPDTQKASLLIGTLTDVTRNSFTLTFMTTPREIYHFRKKN